MQPLPRHHTPRSERPSRGAGVATIAKAKGRPLMPWQQRAADVALEVDPATGLPWYGIVVVTVPRQSGKTKLIGDVADHRALVVPEARVWYTAQTGKDASSWMRDEHFPSLDRARIFGRPGTPSCRYVRSKRAGQEGVDWRHGSTFRVFPPLRDALHGRQSDLVFVDEAWALSADQGADVRQAIRPTMATRPGAQLWIVSTMGDDSSVFFDSYVEQARTQLDNPDSRVCLVDYGLLEDDDPEDVELVASRHPAYGHTVNLDTFTAARADFGHDVAGWVRAYGNQPTRTRQTAIPASVWSTAGRSQVATPEHAGLGIDVTPGLDRAALAAGWRVDDHAYVEVLAAGPATREFPSIVASVARARRVPVVADRGSVGALEVMDALARHYPDVEQHLTATAEYAAACVQFERGIFDDTVHHFNDKDLDAAVTVATKRTLGDGAFGWGRKDSSGSIAELVAATLALRAYDRTPPRKSVRILSTST